MGGVEEQRVTVAQMLPSALPAAPQNEKQVSLCKKVTSPQPLSPTNLSTKDQQRLGTGIRLKFKLEKKF